MDLLKLLRGPLDAESRGIHESGLRSVRKLRYEVENRVLPVFYLHLPPFYLHLVPSLVAKCTGKRPQKTPKLAVKWPALVPWYRQTAGNKALAHQAPGMHWAAESLT